jgi:hypothetical protein
VGLSASRFPRLSDSFEDVVRFLGSAVLVGTFFLVEVNGIVVQRAPPVAPVQVTGVLRSFAANVSSPSATTPYSSPPTSAPVLLHFHWIARFDV